MADKVVMIALSPTMKEGVIAQWIKNEGDTVASGDVLCEVETDKASMDYESTQEGTLLKHLLKEGDKAGVGVPIAIIGKPDEDIEALVNEAVTDIKEAQSDTSSDKDDDNTAKEENQDAPEQEPASPLKSKSSNRDHGRIKISPLARSMAQEEGIDLSKITGSGPEGRIVKRDIEKYMQDGDVGQSSNLHPGKPISTLEDKTIKISQKRKIIAQRLSESKYSAPHYYLKLTIYMDELLQARKQLNSIQEPKVSLNAFLLKFCAEAIKRHPIINASWKGDSIIQHGSIDIGLAVAQEDGLITPVVRDCANKGIVQINEELSTLIDKAKSNTLAVEEYSNATFSISSLGSFGIEEFTAIINPPGSAILAVGEIKKSPIVTNEDELEIKQAMKVSLSCDHRIIDGAIGAAFLKDLKDMMEAPIRCLY